MPRPIFRFYVWLRIGDGGEYEKFDSIDDAAQHLVEFRITEITGWTEHGFTAPGFGGQNYISCYHGDDAAAFVRGFKPSEQDELAEALNDYAREYAIT